MKMYRSWGIDAKREQYGTWRGWRRGPGHIDLIKPRVRSLEATMVGYSPGTGGKDVVASTVILPMVRRQQRVREVAAEGQGQAGAHLGGVSHVPSRRRVGRDGDARVEGAHGHDDREARRRLDNAHSQHRLSSHRR